MDIYYYTYSPEHNPRGPATGVNRSLRGGCWAYDASLCRSAYRVSQLPEHIGFNVGFRLCRSILSR
jgi:formylglycine-generating enzyme required for sulfatase activity